MKIAVIAMALALTPAGALMLGVPASAAPTLDQSQTSATNEEDESLGQSFTAGLTGLLADFTVVNTTAGYASLDYKTLLVQLYSGSDAIPADLLATADIMPAVSGADANFDLSTLGVDVTVGQQYKLVYRETTFDVAVVYGGVTLSNTYARANSF